MPDSPSASACAAPSTLLGCAIDRKRIFKVVKRGLLAALAALTAFGIVVFVDGWQAFGKLASGERKARIEASPQWADGKFENPEPLWNDAWGSLTSFIDAPKHTSPLEPVPVEPVPPERFDTAPNSGLRVTWFGHSSMLVELDGVRVLTDPVWGPRASPLTWMGPARWYEPLIALDELPAIDAVVISHDHYDHLDFPTIKAIREWDTTFIVPLGVASHLEYWGVPLERIVEVQWWDRTQVGPIEIVCTPARHASGRQLYDQNATLWAGYALIGPEHRVYFSGDTGLFSAMKRIGQELGPFDLTMIEDGAYDQAWPDWHIGPEQAVLAHQIVRGKVFFGVHWGLFNLAPHGWTEPIERTLVAAEAANIEVVVPKPGQSFEPSVGLEFERWWPERTWRSAKAYPIRSTKVDALREEFAK